MKVSFILLAHEAPESLRVLIETLLASGSDVYIHHDANSTYDLKSTAQQWQLDRFSGRLFHAKRVKVTWGEYSIVQATLNCLKLACQQGYNADYFMLISGSCMPVKPIYFLENFLEKNAGIDFIEVVNAWQKRWITDGIQQERWENFHFINWRSNPLLFDLSLKFQKKLKIKRKLPLKHTPYMGSQWWCLRATTVDSTLNLIKKHRKLTTFYRRTWVPDELFIQTMVGNLIPEEEISAQILTRYKFNSWGIPRVYYDDDLPELLAENTFFARKISHRAKYLKKELNNICTLSEVKYQTLLNNQQNEYAVKFRNRLALQKKLKEHTWFALASAQQNEYDYIKSIPNPMIVVVSSSDLVRKSALEELKKLPNSIVFGNLLGKTAIDFGTGITSFAGYNSANTQLAQYNWHLFLGEIAFHSKGKTLVFSLGDESLPYLTVLRWKTNLSVIVLDGEFSSERQDELIASIYINSQASHLVGSDSKCNFARLPFALFKETSRAMLSRPCRVEEFAYKLANLSTQSDWPSLRSKTYDRYDFLKSITNPMIIVYAAEEKAARYISTHIQRRSDACVYLNVFKHVPADRKYTDWHYYLGDLSHLSGKKIVVFCLDPEHVFYLETLRWKPNLAVLIVDYKTLYSANQDLGLKDLQEIRIKEAESQKARNELGVLLQDKHCQAYYLESDNLRFIDEAVEKFTNENEYDYIKSIPNPMFVVVSSSERNRKLALSELKKLPNSVIYDDLFSDRSIHLHGKTDLIVGYKNTNINTIDDKWHLFLGEIAFQAKDKTLVFSLGDESLPYLTVLRWKANLTVIVLDDELYDIQKHDFFASIYINSQASHLVGSDSHCRLARLPFSSFKEITRLMLSKSCSVEDYSYRLATMSSQSEWPSLLSKTYDRYDFLKSITNPMIIVYAAEEKTAQFVSAHIQKRSDVCVYHHAFEHILPDRKQTDWHYYLGDLSHLAKEKMVVFHLDPEHVFYLEALRWKKNLAVLVVDSKPWSPFGLESGLDDLREIRIKEADIYSARKELGELLHDKYCQAYFLETDNLIFIDKAIEKFTLYLKTLETEKTRMYAAACQEAGILLPRVLSS